MDSHPLGIILFHKQSTSARVRFLRAANGSVVFATEIPKLATLVDETTLLDKGAGVAKHPAMVLREIEQQMGLAKDAVELVKDFRAKLDIPGQIIPIYLAFFKDIDPPFDAAQSIGAKFIAVTEARGLPPAELQLLQKAYEYIMG